MKISKIFFKTYRENPADAEINSHKLLVRAGYIKKQAAGIYVFLPLGIRALHKLTNVIREEMDKAGACETIMSSLLPIEVYASRAEHFGASMFRLTDRTGKEMCLGPSHEEIFAGVVKDAVTSYKQLPITLYQIQTKFRDEVRSRFGLMRCKEFLMKDAYSYDKDLEGLDKSYNIMKDAYIKIFNRLGLDFVIVDADNGTMGGDASQEFMVKSNIGEDEIIICNNCGYSANTEKAECKEIINPAKLSGKKMVKEHTPNEKTIADLARFFNKNENEFLKAVVYSYDKGVAVALVPGDREVEDVKLGHALGNTIKLEMASHEEIESIGSVAGFGGAIGLKNCVVIADESVKNMADFIIGANEKDYHYDNVNLSNLHIDKFADIKKVAAGDLCPHCGKELSSIRGIEVGHIFKQETKYSKMLDVKYLDENGKSQYMQTGSYGIGVTRTLSAMVEQFSDEKGIILPEEIAPYRVYIIIVNSKDEIQKTLAEEIHDTLQAKGVEVLLDDRNEQIGVKLTDAELIGVPHIVVVGRDAKEGKVEYIERKSLNKETLSKDDIINKF